MLLLSFFPIRFSIMEKERTVDDLVPEYFRLYHEMELEDVIDIKAFQQAVEGYRRIDPENKGVITVIDYSKTSDR